MLKINFSTVMLKQCRGIIAKHKSLCDLVTSLTSGKHILIVEV